MNNIPLPNYTQVPNIIFDHWMQILSLRAFKVLICMCRKTFGWHKTNEIISKNHLAKLCGLGKTTVHEAIKELDKHKLIIIHQLNTEYGCQPNMYSINIFKAFDNIYQDPEEQIPNDKIVMYSPKSEQGGSAQSEQGGSAQSEHPIYDKEKHIQKKTTTSKQIRAKQASPKSVVVVSSCEEVSSHIIEPQRNITYIRSDKKPPNSEEVLTVTNSKGRKVSLTIQEIYQHFEKFNLPAGILKQAIDHVKDNPNGISNLLQYLHGICDNLVRDKKIKRPQKQEPKQVEDDYEIISQRRLDFTKFREDNWHRFAKDVRPQDMVTYIYWGTHKIEYNNNNYEKLFEGLIKLYME